MIEEVKEKDKLLLMNVANEIIKEKDSKNICVDNLEDMYNKCVYKEEVLCILLSLSNDFYHKKNVMDVIQKKESKKFVVDFINNYNKKKRCI